MFIGELEVEMTSPVKKQAGIQSSSKKVTDKQDTMSPGGTTVIP